MANIDNAFSIEKLSLNDEVLLTTGTIDPSVSGYEAPEGSVFLRQSGAASAVYVKDGALDTDWNLLSTASGVVSADSVTFDNLASGLTATNVQDAIDELDSAIDTHFADGTIHFTEASINHDNILNVGTNSHASIDTHLANLSIHYPQTSIDHTVIQNIGTNSHAQIDSHIADGTIHYTQAAISITESQISDFGSYIPTSEKGVANGVATLDGLGKIPTTQVPSIAITDVFVVADIPARDALTVQTGDVAKVTDSDGLGNPQTYIYDGTIWIDIQETSNVISVNGFTGVVSLGLDDQNDVTLTGPIADNEVLAYDTGSGQWINQTQAEADIATATDLAAHEADWNNPHQTNVVNLTDTTIVTPLDSQALVYDEIAGKWKNYTIAVPPPGGGRLIQVSFAPIGSLSGTSTIPITDSPPNQTQGSLLWSDTITPTEATSAIRIHSTFAFYSTNAGMEMVVVVFRDDGTTITPVGAATNTSAKTNSGANFTYTIYDTPNSILPLTYSVYVGKEGGPGTWYINSHPGWTTPLGSIFTNNSYSLEEIGTS